MPACAPCSAVPLKKSLPLSLGDSKVAVASLQEATPIIDRMVNKGIIHKNKAARHKSRLTHQIKKLDEKAAA